MLKKTAMGYPIYGDLNDDLGHSIRVAHAPYRDVERCIIQCSKSGLSATPHLSVQQAKQMIRYLQKFVRSIECKPKATQEKHHVRF